VLLGVFMLWIFTLKANHENKNRQINPVSNRKCETNKKEVTEKLLFGLICGDGVLQVFDFKFSGNLYTYYD
jgi:hypothetical protein